MLAQGKDGVTVQAAATGTWTRQWKSPDTAGKSEIGIRSF